MDIDDIIANQNNINEKTELDNILLIKEQNEELLENMQNYLKLYNNTIESIELQIKNNIKKMEKIKQRFSNNNKHLRSALINLHA